MVKFFEAVIRPFEDLKALVLGVVLGAMPIINFLLFGFGLRESEKLLHGMHKPITWWNMCDIVFKSIAAFTIVVFYFSPVIFAAIVFLGPLVVEASSIINESGLVQLALWGSSPFELYGIFLNTLKSLGALAFENILLVVPAAFLAVLFYYLLPFALINFIREGKMIEAFNSKIIGKAHGYKVFFYWLLFHLYLIALFAFLCLFFFLPVLNLLLVGFILFVYFYSGFHLFTQLFLEST